MHPKGLNHFTILATKALELFINDTALKCKQIDIDKYHRDVMHCFVNDTDLGGLMVKTGFAKDYTKYSGGFYSSEENFAREEQLGIWK